MRQFIFVFTFLLFCRIGGYTQVKVREAIGRWEVTKDISLAEAEEKALFEAKRDALRQAGVEDEVAYSFLEIQGVDTSFYKRVYNYIGRGEIRGIVQVSQKTVRKIYEEVAERLFVEVRIRAKVKKPLQRDPGFKIELEGLHNTYRQGEGLSFSCRVFKDCYLKIFVFDPSGGFRVYPNRYEDDRCFQCGDVFHFPRECDVEYVLTKNGRDDWESNVMLIVATREKIPYTGKADYESVLEWLFEIPLRDRVEVWHNFVIE